MHNNIFVRLFDLHFFIYSWMEVEMNKIMKFSGILLIIGSLTGLGFITYGGIDTGMKSIGFVTLFLAAFIGWLLYLEGRAKWEK